MKDALDWLIDDESLPSVAFLKLYDCRYLDESMEEDAKEPWKPEKEVDAEKYAQTLINGGGPTSLTIAWNSTRDSDDGSADEDRKSEPSDDEMEN